MAKAKAQKDKQEDTVRVIHSVKLKMIAIIVVAMATMSTMLSLLYIRNTKAHIMEINSNYLYDLCDIYGTKIQQEINLTGYDMAVSYDNLNATLNGVGLAGVSSSYAYLVSKDGTMMYHPVLEKVGAPVENAVISGIVEQVQAGVIPEPEIVRYEFEGATKCAAYYIVNRGECILVLTVDQADLLKDANEVRTVGITCAVVLVLVVSIVGYMIVAIILKPLAQVTDIISRLANMDFSEIKEEQKLIRRKDETGMMSRAVVELRARLTQVVVNLRNQSEHLFQASDSLNTNASETANTVEQVEKAVSEISDGASSQADETQKATENVLMMGNMVEETSLEVKSLIENANDMKKSGDEASETLSALEKINEQAVEAIDIIYEQTNTTNESALKIREATTLITSIAEETNLLSLNASIEAARAGEQGRGFAVVASQIQKLAEQSNDSAQQIESIIDSLISDSQKAVTTMAEVKEIMSSQSKNVEKTDAIFTQVKEGIAHSIEGVERIADKTRRLDEARINVVDIVQNLTAIAEENAASTEETSASVTEVSGIVYNISDNASQLKNVANELEENMSIFKM